MNLYRSADGLAWELVATPKLTPGPMMQITDVFKVPDVGLMAFWFGGSYGNDMKPRRWGVMTSADNGASWVQRTCGEGMAKKDWPTEPSGVSLGGGRILALARTEAARCGSTRRRPTTRRGLARSISSGTRHGSPMTARAGRPARQGRLR